MLNSGQSFTYHAVGNKKAIITPVFVTAHSPGIQKPNLALKCDALWDSGASRSVVTPACVKELGLKQRGATKMLGVGGPRLTQTYLVDLYFSDTTFIKDILVAECSAHKYPFDFIIGMDIMVQGDFAITSHLGSTVVSFRFPSEHKIDFVSDAKEGRFLSNAISKRPDEENYWLQISQEHNPTSMLDGISREITLVD